MIAKGVAAPRRLSEAQKVKPWAPIITTGLEVGLGYLVM